MEEATALGVLATVITAVGGAGAWLLRTLLSDVLATNRALRETLVGMARRLRDHALEAKIQGDMIQDIHGRILGSKRASDYGEAREEIVRRARTERAEDGES